MSNTLIIDSLNTLFSMSNTAVIGAQEQFVAFMNPAAQELFRGNRTNHKLTELLPAHITEATATEFVTSATIEKRHVIISVTVSYTHLIQFTLSQIIYFVISLPVTAGSMLRDRVN